MSARDIDANGFITIEKNPISRVGVFPYYGRNISTACEPDKIYYVYRPAEELSDPEAMKSFALAPLIDDHTMLGAGFTPAEEKVVHGTLGEKLQFENGILYASLRIFSEKLKALLEKGKKALSLGYRVREWEPCEGIFNGTPYQFIQRGLRGNHIALVDAARMGPDIAVLDHSFACDSFEINLSEEGTSKEAVTDDKSKIEDGNALQEEALACGDVNQPKGADMTDKEKEEKAAADAKIAKDAKDAADAKIAKDAEEKEKADKEKKEAEDKAAKDEDTEEEPGEQKKAMDAAIKVAVDSAIDVAVEKRIAGIQGMLLKTLSTSVAARDKLAREVSSVVGTFDHADKSVEEVLAYGLEKAGIQAPKGQEQGAWAGFMAGRSKSSGALAFDSKQSTAGLVDKTLADSQ